MVELEGFKITKTFIMKTLIYFLFFSIFFSSCSKMDSLTKFHLKITESTSIPAMLNINLPFEIYTPNIETNIVKELEVRNSHKDRVESIHLSILELTITNPYNGTFDFLKSIEIVLTADGMSDILIAHKENIKDNIGSKITLDVEDVELKNYILKDFVKIKIKVVTDKITTQKYDVELFTDFFVDAKILGV